MDRHDLAWQTNAAVHWYLGFVRGAIPFAAEQPAIMLRFVAQGRQPVTRFLDVGAGDGALSAVMLATYPAAGAVLIDFSPPMLDAAQERLGSRWPTPAFIASDLASPDWREAVAAHAPFDAIVSGFAILFQHLEDERKRALYGELFDLLAPGGAFAHIEHVASETAWIADAFDEAMISAIREYRRLADPALRYDDVAAAYVSRPDREANRLAPLDLQCAWLREAGFTDVVIPFRWYEMAVFGGYRAA